MSSTLASLLERAVSLREKAEALLAASAPSGSAAAAAVLEALDETLLAAWTASEAAGGARTGASEGLEGFLFYRRGLLRRLARGGAKPGAGLLQALFQGSAGRRLFLFVTHACQLRCAYCHVAKGPARMSPATVEAGVRLMLRSVRRDVELHFFGGEPMLAFDAVREATELARELAGAAGKRVGFLLTTNGVELSEEALGFLAERRFTLEFSCDGAHEAQLRQRAPAGGGDYYGRLQANLARLREAGVAYNVITVVLPRNVSGLLAQFRYLARLGHRRIQVNYALGSRWDARSSAAFFRQLEAAARWAREEGVVLVNASAARREPVILNGDLTLDCDGSLFRGPVLFDGRLVREADGRASRDGAGTADAYRAVRESFHAARVDRALLPDWYGATPFDNFALLSRAYAARPAARAVVLNNVEMGLRCRERARLWRPS